ncbi:hypothetical protein [Aminobacter sp. BE322]|uniref:hypothetical protein n=1 Tax=unclassified Aminobacter TaxID=2644704 RepID=UPI003D1D4305
MLAACGHDRRVESRFEAKFAAAMPKNRAAAHMPAEFKSIDCAQLLTRGHFDGVMKEAKAL